MNSALAPAPGSHFVQFYEGERLLHRAAAEFFGEALQNGDICLMIVRPRVYEAVIQRLASERGATAADLANRIHFVDVDAAIDGFMDGPTLDPERLQQNVLALQADLRRTGGDGTIWIVGEMAPVLYKAGNQAAAIRLEELWNQFFAGPQFSVLCTYAIDSFDDDLLAHRFRAICREHTLVMPAEGFADAPDDRTRCEHVALLQQRARALAHGLPAAVPLGSVVPTSTVYLIDDDASVRRSLGRLLVSIGVDVRTFASAEAFLAEVDGSASGCVVLDVQLNGMSGFDLQMRLADAYKSMRVVAMSGTLDPQIEAEALRLGAKAFLPKPFEAAELIEAVTQALA